MRTSRLPQLSAHYGQLAGVELYSINEQIDQAQAMLAHSLGVLRECFTALGRESGADHPAADRLPGAMMALQAEDMVGQLLDHTRLRLATLARLTQLQDRLIAELSHTLVAHCDDPALLARFEARLGEAVNGLMDLAALQQPVKEGTATSGPVQLFGEERT